MQNVERKEDASGDLAGLEHQLLEAITRAQSEFVQRGDPRDVFDGLLSALLGLTQSEYGFIGEVLYTADGSPYLKTHAITNIAWNQETRRLYDENAAAGLEFFNLDTLFGAVIRTGVSVIANDPANDTRSGGLPEGHPPLDSFLGLPFYSNGELIGMVGIANRLAGYDDELVLRLGPLLLTCSNIILALRANAERNEAERSLRESEARGRAILENSLDAIVTIDESGIIDSCNPATHTLFGYELDELLGANVRILMDEPYRSRHDEYLRRYVTTGQARIIGIGREVTGRRKDGTLITLELAINQLQLDGRRLFVGVMRDISERKRNEQELRRLNEEASLRVQALRRLDRDNSLLSEFGSFLQACHRESEAWAALATCALDFFPGQGGAFYRLDEHGNVEIAATWGDMQAPLTPLFPKTDCWALRRGQPHAVWGHRRSLACAHLEGLDCDGSICVPVMSQDGPLGVLTLPWSAPESTEETPAVLAERQERILASLGDRLGVALSSIRLRERLEDESVRDPLTRLYNRRYMDDFLARETRRSRRTGLPLSVLIADVDHFKSFNDEHGHDAGDLVLREVSRCLVDAVRAEDVVCRMGGEEFVVIMPGAQAADAARRGEEMRRSVSRLRLEGTVGRLRPVSISLGVASFPQHAQELDDLLGLADRALYEAKASGRDRVTVAAGADAVDYEHVSDL